MSEVMYDFFFPLLLTSISFFRLKMRTNNFSFVCLQHLYPSDFFSADYLKHSPSVIFSQSMFFPETYKKRKIWWWKAKFGVAKFEFHWRICNYVCPLQKICYVRQNLMENCNSAVWFLSFSLAVTREESNPGAELCCGCSGRVDQQRPDLASYLPASAGSSFIVRHSSPLQGTTPSLLRRTAAFSLLRSLALSQTSHRRTGAF